ncbi:MAG: ABC transporter permease [Clostridiales bacterium]|nr:ABC transporter permease [Clostridiales bacterium]
MAIDVFLGNLKYIYDRRRKLYSTVFAIAIGMTLVVTVSAVGEIGTDLIQQEVESLGVGSVTITANKTVADVPLTEEKLESLRQQPEVSSASPIIMSYTQVKMKGVISQCAVWGVESGSSQIIELEPIHGRILTPEDIAEGRQVCVIDRNMAEAFYGRSNIVGKQLDVMLNNQYLSFEVVGVVESGGNLMQGMLSYAPYFAYVPYNVLQQACGKNGYDSIAVTLTDQEQADETGQKLVENLAADYGEQEGSYLVENMFTQKQKLQNITDIVKLSLVAISAVSLLVSGLGVMTVMTSSVTERTREIGIKKAIGAKNSTILLEFISEGGILSLIGGLLGLLFGQGSVYLLCTLFHLNYSVDTRLLLFGVLTTVIMGTVFSAKPALRAARLDPVEALSFE